MYFIDKNNKVVANYITLKLEKETGEVYAIHSKASHIPVLEEEDLAVAIAESWYEYGTYTVIQSQSAYWPLGRTILRTSL